MIIAIILIYAASLLGILGHWATRHYQARTTSTFAEYLKANIGYTLASFSANLSGATMITMAITPDMTLQQIAVLVGTAYTTGYSIDSKINRDKPQETIQQTAQKDEQKSLDSVLADDRTL